MSTLLKPATERFWQTYLEEEAPDPAKARSWLYEAFKIGTTEEGADHGALLTRGGSRPQPVLCCGSMKRPTNRCRRLDLSVSWRMDGMNRSVS